MIFETLHFWGFGVGSMPLPYLENSTLVSKGATFSGECPKTSLRARITVADPQIGRPLLSHTRPKQIGAIGVLQRQKARVSAVYFTLCSLKYVRACPTNIVPLSYHDNGTIFIPHKTLIPVKPLIRNYQVAHHWPITSILFIIVAGLWQRAKTEFRAHPKWRQRRSRWPSAPSSGQYEPIYIYLLF